MRSLIYTSLLTPSLAFLLISPSVHATELLQTAKVACNPEKYKVSLRDAAGNIVASPAMLQNIVNRNGCEAIYSPSALEAISSGGENVSNPVNNELELKMVYRIPASLPVISGTLYHNGNQLLTGEVKPDKPEDYQAVVQQGERVVEKPVEVMKENTYTHILK